MHRDEHRAPPGRGARIEETRDGRVVGDEDGVFARRGFGGRERLVAGHARCLAEDGDRAFAARPPVAVDDEARIGLEDRRRIEALGKMAGHRGDADVPGNVAAELRLGETQSAEAARDPAPGMIGGEDEIRRAMRAQNLYRRGLVGGEEGGSAIGHCGICAALQ